MADGADEDKYDDDFEEERHSPRNARSAPACSSDEAVESQSSKVDDVPQQNDPPPASAAGKVPLDAVHPRSAASACAAPLQPQRDSAADSGDGWAPVNPRELDIGPQLGGGGFAVVYRAVYRGAGVAVKMIVDPAATSAQQEDFMAELNTMAAVSGHRNIVRLIGASPTPPRQCIVMELCRCSLHDVLQGGGGGSSVPLVLRAAWALDVARALAFLHARRPAVIHRDIKR
jgi:hypothetical protein